MVREVVDGKERLHTRVERVPRVDHRRLHGVSQIRGYKCRLPVVAVDNIRLPLQALHELKRLLRKKRESLGIVFVVSIADRVEILAMVVRRCVYEVPVDAVARLPMPDVPLDFRTGELLYFARHDLLEPECARVDLPIPWHHRTHLAAKRGKRDGERTRDISQATGFREWNSFRGYHENADWTRHSWKTSIDYGENERRRSAMRLTLRRCACYYDYLRVSFLR